MAGVKLWKLLREAVTETAFTTNALPLNAEVLMMVIANNDVGKSKESVPLEVTTAPAQPPSAITSLTIVNLSGESAELAWTAPEVHDTSRQPPQLWK